jgi:ParB-like chromosome segregation protein Spo0J
MVPRSEIKLASYNPRTITVEAKKRLRDGLREFGMVEPLIWNKRTGNLVGGHQRLGILDTENRGHDYKVPVSVIDLNEKGERKLNLLLNNQSAQGDWDTKALEDLVRGLDGDIEHTGFDKLELQALCANLDGLFEEKKDASVDTAKQLEELKSRRKEWKGNARSLDDSEFYVVLVFQDRPELEAFMKRCELDLSTRYHDGQRFADLLKA